MGNAFKKLLFSIRQGLGNVMSFRSVSLLLFACYTVGFLFPLMVWSYRDGMIDLYSESPTLDVMKVNNSIGYYNAEGETRRQKPSEALSADYFKSILPEGASVLVRIHISQTAIYGDYPLIANITYVNTENDPVFIPFYYNMEFLAGRSIENDNEILVGRGALPRGTVFERILGDSIQVGNSEYTICGVVDQSDQLFLSMNVLDTFYSPFHSISLSSPNMAYSEFKSISNAFEKTFVKQAFESSAGRDEIYVEAAKQIGAELLPFALLALFFCGANALALLTALLSMKKRNYLIRMSLGASAIDVFIEQLAYVGAISLAAAAAAYLLALGIAKISVSLGVFRLLIQPGQIFGLLALAFLISAATSAGFAYFASRLNLGSVGRSV